MQTFIEKSLLYKQLCKKAELDSSLKILLSQWEFDFRLVGRALQNINQLFPHYTLHDSSHSNTILQNIERILGEDRINLLSGSDIWLLMESSYYHDLGMVVSDERMRSIWKNEDFHKYLEKIISNKDDELYTTANFFHNANQEKELIAFINSNKNDWPFEIKRNLILLTSSFIRQNHNERSASIAIHPKEELGLESPRTNLISPRLIVILSKVCKAHGENFIDVLKLPFEENGMSSEDYCHPRFCAALLRLGDLLDIDCGRVCEVMIRTFGELPLNSHHHHNKHLNIRRFLITPKEIEIEISCNSYPEYKIATDWLDWIKEEVRNQSENWNQIAPRSEFGLMPVAKKVSAELRDYNTLELGKIPKFEIDKDFITFIEGNNLYGTEFVFVRELIQNSIDATLVKVWIDCRKTISKSDPKKEFDLFLKNYPIQIYVEELECDLAGKEKLKFTIKDCGVGISFDDFKKISKVGSQNKKLIRKKIVEEMPEFLRPSGHFGIGLQSVFIVTNNVTMHTKSAITNEEFEVILSKTSSLSSADILIKKKEGDPFETHGCYISFQLYVDAVPRTIGYREKGNSAEQSLLNYDPLKPGPMGYYKALIEDMIRKVAKESSVPIILNNTQANSLEGRRFHFFDFENLVELSLNIQPKFSNHVSLYYRDQFVDSRSRFSRPLINMSLNVLFSDSKKMLNITREEFRKEGALEIQKKLPSIINNGLEFLLKRILSTTEEKDLIPTIALYDLLYNDEKLSKKYRMIERRWEEFVLIENLNLGEVVSHDIVELTSIGEFLDGYPSFEKDNNVLKLFLEDNPHSEQFLYIESLRSLLLKYFYKSNFVSSEIVEKHDYHIDKNLVRYEKGKREIRLIDKKIFEGLLEGHFYENSYNLKFKRILMPMFNEKYQPLEISENTKLRFVHQLNQFSKIIFPFVRLPDGKYVQDSIKELANFVKNNSSNDEIDLEEIIFLYEELVLELEPLMKGVISKE